jgi:hypothetical protein
MMKTPIKSIITGLLLLLVVMACKKVEHGFLSNQIRYRDSPIQIQRGIVTQTRPVDNDGSSAPVTYELLDIRDAVTKKHADLFYTNFDRYIFISQFDVNVDTTIELLNTHRQLIKAPAVEFNQFTGAFTFYGTTANVPVGDYEFDVRASNENGTKEYKNVGTFTLFEGPVAEQSAGGGAWFKDGSTTSGDIGEPEVKIKKLSTEGTLIILKIVDKNGTPFNPRNNEIIKRGDRNSFDTFARFHPLVLTDSTMTCNFEVTPFPLVAGPPGQGYTIYYRIPGTFARLDPGLTPTPDRGYSVNPRFTFRIYQEGTYEVTVRIKNATRDVIR